MACILRCCYGPSNKVDPGRYKEETDQQKRTKAVVNEIRWNAGATSLSNINVTDLGNVVQLNPIVSKMVQVGDRYMLDVGQVLVKGVHSKGIALEVEISAGKVKVGHCMFPSKGEWDRMNKSLVNGDG